jgi:hypothetical protein
MDVSGRLTATTKARAFLAALPLPLRGRITTTASAIRSSFTEAPTRELSGRITTATRFFGRTAGPYDLRGRITTAVRTTSEGFFPPPQAYILEGRTSLTVRAIGTIQEIVALRARILIATKGQIRLRLQIYGEALNFAGRISAKVTSRASTDPSQPLAGRITTASTARLQVRQLGILSGRISTTIRASIRYGLAYVSGTIITAVQGLGGVPLRMFRGRVTTAGKGSRATLYLRPVYYLSGQITSTTKSTFVGQYPSWIGGQITTAAGGYWHFYPYCWRMPFAGRTSSITELRSRPLLPLFYLLNSVLTATTTARLAPAELIPQLPPYPEAFTVENEAYYLDLITSEHNQKVKYTDTVALSVEPYIGLAELSADLPGLFDLDYSQGEQEDFVGEWIGKSRWIELATTFFSWDLEKIGWDHASWKGPFDTGGYLQRLDDFHYRLLLYSTIIVNHWDGSITQAYRAWDTLFEYTGLRVVIQDYGNMTMMYGLLWDYRPDTILLSLFVTGEMDLKPEGIELIAYIFQYAPGEPLFAFDAESSSVHGWDAGFWGYLTPPGSGYIPI